MCKLCIAKVIWNWFRTKKVASYPYTSYIPGVEFYKKQTNKKTSFESTFEPFSTVAFGGDKYANQT